MRSVGERGYHLRGFLVVALVGMLGLACAALQGAAAGSGTAAEVRGGTLTIGVDQECVGLDPNIVTAFSSFRRIDLLYNRLVKYDSDLKVVPDLAESWEVPDNLTYVFHLYRGVKFHNGRDLTAEDVKFTLERILDPKTGSPARSYIEPVTTVEALDRHTVRLKLKSPLASLLSGLCSNNCAIVPREEVEKHGNLQRVVCGTGPFRFEEWVPDNYMRLVRNPDYFKKGLPLLDGVTFKVIPDQMSLLAAVRTGSLDMATIGDGSVIVQAKKDPNLVVKQVPSLNARTFGFNCTREPLDDPRVRKAMALVIDRWQVIACAEFGFGTPTGPVPASSKQWAVPVSELPNSVPSVAAARALLAEAGYPKGFSMKILTSPTYEGGLAVAQVIQSQLATIGINASLEVVEWGMYIDRWKKRDYDGIVELRGGDPDPDRFLFRMLHSTGAVNNFLFKDVELDALLERGRSAVATGERRSVYEQVQRLICEEAPVVFLYVPVETQVLRSNVKGFKQVSNGSLYYLEDAYMEK